MRFDSGKALNPMFDSIQEFGLQRRLEVLEKAKLLASQVSARLEQEGETREAIGAEKVVAEILKELITVQDEIDNLKR